MNRLLSESLGENEDLFFLAPYFFISYSFGFSVTPRFFEWSLDSTFYCFCQSAMPGLVELNGWLFNLARLVPPQRGNLIQGRMIHLPLKPFFFKTAVSGSICVLLSCFKMTAHPSFFAPPYAPSPQSPLFFHPVLNFFWRLPALRSMHSGRSGKNAERQQR